MWVYFEYPTKHLVLVFAAYSSVTTGTLEYVGLGSECNPSTWEAGADESLSLRQHCLKKKKKKL